MSDELICCGAQGYPLPADIDDLVATRAVKLLNIRNTTGAI